MALLASEEDVHRFLPLKIHRPQQGLRVPIWGPIASMLPRDLQGLHTVQLNPVTLI